MIVESGISGLALIVAAYLVALVHRVGSVPLLRAAAIPAAIMTLQFLLAAQGVLARWDSFPPPMMLVVGVAIAVVIATALSRLGGVVAGRATFALLIGYQAFRLPLEWVMHRAATDALMPVQMSYSGWNFDIISGTLAIPVALAAALGRAPRWLLWTWNFAGTLLLVNIIVIAAVSLPVFAAFGPDRVNTWVTQAPYVWLPGVLVPAALFGHLLVWRKLALRPSTRR
jgi:hypothetical protein